MAACDVTVIVPLKNEEESIPVLAGEIEAAFASTEYDWECLWVNDGSTDRSQSLLLELYHSNPRHQYVTLAKNFGQSAAMATGFKEARGRILATIDGDLQNDPADIPKLIAHLEQSRVHMVNGYRATRRDHLVRKISSRIANGFRNRMTGRTVRDVGCSLRVFYRECVEDIPVWKGMHRFIPTLVKMRGYRMTEIPVHHRPRKFGKTKYGVNNRLWVGLWDTFGVRWLQGRFVRARIGERSEIPVEVKE